MAILKITSKDEPERLEYIYGFVKGVNKLQDESLIDDNELSGAKNNILVVDGVKKRGGTLNYGSDSGSRVYGASPFYTSAASLNRWMIREGGTSLMYYNDSSVPTAIAGATMTAAKRTEFAMARDTLYVENGTDNLIKVAIAGGVPAATVFTALTTPTNLAITPTGSAGSTHYSYRVSAYNLTGETLACVSVETTTGNATLSSTNYNALAWTAVSNAVGYNIYGRYATHHNGIGETKMASVQTNAYNDTGVDTPSTVLTPPEGNSTGGQKGSMIKFAMSRLFVSGDSTNPSRLYYSGAGTQIDDFSTAYSGGWVDISKNDGDSITAFDYFQNVIIVFKHRSIWRFSFTSTGLPQVELLTNEVGCESFRTVKIVDNDLWFVGKKDGRVVIMSIGNVPNYFNSIRTVERSLKISSGSYLDSANLAQITNSCAYYFRNLYIVCLANGSSTTNDRCYVYDSRFGAWLGYWDGIPANNFFTYSDSSGTEDLFYSSETSGYVVKMFTGTDDNGTAVTWQILTKNFMQKYFDQYKIYRNPVLWFKDVTNGVITGYVVNDGIFSSGSFKVTPIVSGIGAGYDMPGLVIAGDSEGASTSVTNSDQPTELLYNKVARSIKFQLQDDGSTSDFKFLGLSYKWMLLTGKPLPPTNRIRLS
jgi:hypothetical protein